MKLRILWCGEASVLNTGYSVYGREILKRLWKTGKYEIAEFASYIDSRDNRISTIPWKVYANLPDNEEQEQEYKSNPINQFGAWRFENVCLDFNPHVILSIRDQWMMSHEETSPFRPYYKLVWMPTVDAEHQNKEWLSQYASCDAVFTYQDWSGEVLKREANNTINWLGSASPCADKEFQPYNREEIKKQLGFSDYNIIGTVMRNQRRKLFPNLFQAFRQYLDETQDNKTLLYCHTSYPDRGWDIPELLMENGLCSKVLFTYVCQNCGDAYPSLFADAIQHCKKCGVLASICSNVNHGVSNKVLASIYNLFDLYIQYSCAEGMGMPAVEAAACGVPVAEVDYSAMSDVVRKLAGTPIRVLTKYAELETGCLRAIPDDQHLVEIIKNFLSITPEERQELRVKARKAFEKHYNWDNTAKVWINYLDTINVKEQEEKWVSPPRITEPSNQIPQNISNANFAKFLISEVLGEPERLNTYMESRLIRDLNYRVTTSHVGGMYYNEMSQLFSGTRDQREFSHKEAYEHMLSLNSKKNYWEQRRAEKFGL